MNSKQEATEIYRSYRGFNNESFEINHNTAIQCAILCVEKIIYVLSQTLDFKMEKSIKHYQDVLIELNNM